MVRGFSIFNNMPGWLPCLVMACLWRGYRWWWWWHIALVSLSFNIIIRSISYNNTCRWHASGFSACFCFYSLYLASLVQIAQGGIKNSLNEVVAWLHDLAAEWCWCWWWRWQCLDIDIREATKRQLSNIEKWQRIQGFQSQPNHWTTTIIHVMVLCVEAW